jgi:hypothetical protein
VQDATEPIGRVDRREHADVVAPPEELLRERLDVPVDAAWIAPGVWRDESYTHEATRVVDAQEAERGADLRTRPCRATFKNCE